jgi:hypothetical protein
MLYACRLFDYGRPENHGFFHWLDTLFGFLFPEIRQLDYYNLDMLISGGYRIKSHVATRHIKVFIIKGFVLDAERIKNPELSFD